MQIVPQSFYLHHIFEFWVCFWHKHNYYWTSDVKEMGSKCARNPDSTDFLNPRINIEKLVGTPGQNGDRICETVLSGFHDFDIEIYRDADFILKG